MCQNQASDQIPALSDQQPFQIQVPLGAVKLPHKRVSDPEKPHEGEEGQVGPRQPLTSLTSPQAETLRPLAACQHSLGPQRSPRPTTVTCLCTSWVTNRPAPPATAQTCKACWPEKPQLVGLPAGPGDPYCLWAASWWICPTPWGSELSY